MKILAICSIILFLFLPGGKMEKIERITNSFDLAVSMNIIIDNEETLLKKGNEKFEKILKTLKDITEYSHDMPAFGVSLDNLTKEEMKAGIWLELEFKKTYLFNEMPFDALLIKVEQDSYGFNLIRRNNGKYEGRCFYLSLNESLNNLYEVINLMAI